MNNNLCAHSTGVYLKIMPKVCSFRNFSEHLLHLNFLNTQKWRVPRINTEHWLARWVTYRMSIAFRNVGNLGNCATLSYDETFPAIFSLERFWKTTIFFFFYKVLVDLFFSMEKDYSCVEELRFLLQQLYHAKFWNVSKIMYQSLKLSW